MMDIIVITAIGIVVFGIIFGYVFGDRSNKDEDSGDEIEDESE